MGAFATRTPSSPLGMAATPGISPHIIAQDDISLSAVVEPDAVVGIARYDVTVSRVRAADRVVRRVQKHDAAILVAKRGVSRGVDPDKIALNGVPRRRCAVQFHTFLGVRRGNVPGNGIPPAKNRTPHPWLPSACEPEASMPI